MKITLIRHGITAANRETRLLFGNEGAPLLPKGIIQAESLRSQLEAQGYNLTTEPVAVSPMLRTLQTAEHAGFQNTRIEPLLTEIDSGLDAKLVTSMLARREVPETVLKKVREMLKTPPPERIWVTHGFIIVALCRLLDQDYDQFIPDFCEIRTIDI